MNRSAEDAQSQARLYETTLEDLYGAGKYILDIIRVGRPGEELSADVETAVGAWNGRVDALGERWDEQYGELRHVEDLAAHGPWMISMLEETYDEILVLYNEDSSDETIAPPSVPAAAAGSRCAAVVDRFGEGHPGWAALAAEISAAEDRMLTEGIDMEALNDTVFRLRTAESIYAELIAWKEHVDDVVYQSDHDDPLAALAEAEAKMEGVALRLGALFDDEQ